MEFVKQNKWLTGGVVFIVLAFLYYFLFMTGGSAPALSSASTTPSPVSPELLTQLNALKTIQLSRDSAVFSDPGFESLTDFGVVLPPEAAGRPDPFAPTTGAPAQSGSSLAPPPAF